jgi:hypothetical protein
MDRTPSGWLQRRRERARLKALRTGDSPEKLAERRRRGGPPPEEEPGFVEKMFWLAQKGGVSRGRVREKLKRRPK